MLRSREPRFGPAPSRSAIEADLEARDAVATGPVVDLLVQLSGLDCAWLRVGLALAEHGARRSPTGARVAVPIAVGPSDATFWVDADGHVFDDTDLEHAIPVGFGALGLLDYWLVGVGGYRWSGTVHTHVARAHGWSALDLRAVLGQSCAHFAIGDRLSVWPDGTASVADAIDGAIVPPRQAAFSHRNREAWVDALQRVVEARPDTPLRIDVGFADPLRASDEVLARARSVDGYRTERDGWVSVVRTHQGTKDLRRG